MGDTYVHTPVPRGWKLVHSGPYTFLHVAAHLRPFSLLQQNGKRSVSLSSGSHPSPLIEPEEEVAGTPDL